MSKGVGTAAVAILAGMLCSACDRSDGKRPGQPGAVGTAGRAGNGGMTVETTLNAKELPVFVNRDAEGTRLWDLTKQFYQKRGNAPAWIDGRKPTSQMDELIASLHRRTARARSGPLQPSTLATRPRGSGPRFLTEGIQRAEAGLESGSLTLSSLRLGICGGLSVLSPRSEMADP